MILYLFKSAQAFFKSGGLDFFEDCFPLDALWVCFDTIYKSILQQKLNGI